MYNDHEMSHVSSFSKKLLSKWYGECTIEKYVEFSTDLKGM